MVWYEHLPKENACHPTEIYKPKLDLYYPDAQTEREMKFRNSMPVDEYIYGDVFATPTHQMACAWLREVHNTNIDIVSVWNQKLFEYQCFVVTPKNAKHCYIDDKLYLTYEVAVEAALKYSLENLI